MTSDLTIEHNTVLHNDTYGVFSDKCVNQPDDCGEAVHLQTVIDFEVSHNLVQDNVGGILITDENGPTPGNEISDNRVLDNAEDCGITLASQPLRSPERGGQPDRGEQAGGIHTKGAEQLSGLNSNKFDHSVDVPLSIN